MSLCIFRPNEIAEIRLKFSNINKTENQASLRLARKQANVIETYEVYDTDNEKISPKLAIYEWIDGLKKQFPKGTDFLLQHKGFNKPTTTKYISLQLTKLIREPKTVGSSAYSIRHSATTELAKLGIPERDLATFTHHSQNSRTVQQCYIFASSTRTNDIARQLTSNLGQDNERLNQVSQQRDEIRREVVTNYYPRLSWRQGNDLLSQYLLISPLAHLKYVSIPELKQKYGENSLENLRIEQAE
ncbi:MAG: hypothetical protein EZS28_030538 [Streblomastix strix]|uniref:Tyr recombinase domain-containing protein n=1 Tax=Streblomastix strix TaxID=222440 RepID=A0A5J4UTD8_9EUKA|nr:MAG: hypothetical protein EZS28_030538 [Streblomastix strix]